jgi:hypothetical protein
MHQFAIVDLSAWFWLVVVGLIVLAAGAILIRLVLTR